MLDPEDIRGSLAEPIIESYHLNDEISVRISDFSGGTAPLGIYF
jgi:hypothetical protein